MATKLARLVRSPSRARRWWLGYGLVVGCCLSLFSLYLADRLYPLPREIFEIEYSQRIVDHRQQPLRYVPTRDGYWRFPVDLDTVSPNFVDMLIRFEDKRFYQHHGVDMLAMLRAVGQRLTTGHVVSGGSTLTMQLARLAEPKPRTLPNKLREMFRAWQLEWHLDKNEILQAYLTLAPYGGNIQGVEAASTFYFGQSARDLTVSQAALLVSLPQNPERLRPDRHPQAAQSRRDQNLARLNQQGVLSAEAYRLALTSPTPTARQATPQEAMHLSSWYLSPRGESVADGRPLVLTLDRQLQRQISALASGVQTGLAEPATMAIVVADRRQLRARAYVGSGDFFATRFPGQVDVVQAIRSPGSTLKPFIYGLAFSDGWLHPNTLIDDNAADYAGYQPGNFDRAFSGEQTVREALMGSRNLPAIQVLQRLTPQRLVNGFADQGIRLVLPPDQSRVSARATLPIAVGGVGIRLADLIMLYGCLANHGGCQPLIYRQDQLDTSPSGQSPQLMSAQAAWMINTILRDMPKPVRGDAMRSETLQRRPLAFKTGTSYGYRDAWAIGFDQDWVIGVWVGRPDNGFQHHKMGLTDAAPILLSAFDIANQQQFQELLAVVPEQGSLATGGETMRATTPISPFIEPNVDGLERPYLAARSPPPALRWFGAPLAHQRGQQDRPVIFYPIANTRLALPANSAPLYRQRIRVDVQVKHYPLTVILNGERLQPQRNPDDVIQLQPSRSGAYHLQLIDANGQSDRVDFWVDKAVE